MEQDMTGKGRKGYDRTGGRKDSAARDRTGQDAGQEQEQAGGG